RTGKAPRMFFKILDRLEEIIISLLIGGATILIFVAVLHRYGSTVPFLFPYLHDIDMTWAQELCIYMFVWMAKFGAAYGVRQGVHVGVDVLVNRLGVNHRGKVILFGLFAGAVFTGIIAMLGASFVWDLSETDSRSNDLEAPKWIVYLAIPLGSGLMCFRFLQVAWGFWRTGELPHHDPGHVEGVVESPQAARDLAAEELRDAPRPAR
ncbi:MAG: Tripartite ATP-independent periplasmic transporter DctQ component, partial [Enterovirga sp.]|nr:Tripartite ATP-independent periplasmic transporter DctQ component [Enterovirga sp.]